MVLRGLSRLEPLPCANTTNALAEAGTLKVPESPSGGIRTSRVLAARSGLDAREVAPDMTMLHE
jgi:hypothetical protein